jgi:F-type H+-transporting ATPase subunit b
LKAVSLLQLTAVPEGRLFALDQQTLISAAILLVNVIILALVLGKLLYKPVREYMGKRTQRIGAQIADAQDKVAQAGTLKGEYEEKMRGIAAERAAILEEARLEAAKRSQRTMEEAQGEAQRIKRRAEQSMQLEKERLEQENRRHIVDISLVMTEKLVRKSIDEDTHARLFDEALAELEEAPWPN